MNGVAPCGEQEDGGGGVLLGGVTFELSVESQVRKESARCERGWGGGAGVPGRELGSGRGAGNLRVLSWAVFVERGRK